MPPLEGGRVHCLLKTLIRHMGIAREKTLSFPTKYRNHHHNHFGFHLRHLDGEICLPI